MIKCIGLFISIALGGFACYKHCFTNAIYLIIMLIQCYIFCRTNFNPCVIGIVLTVIALLKTEEVETHEEIE